MHATYSTFAIPSLSCLPCLASLNRSNLTVSGKPLYAALVKSIIISIPKKNLTTVYWKKVIEQNS
jgi:hypothetical protein